MIGITCWVGVFIVVTGVLIILVVREVRRQRPLNLADLTKHFCFEDGLQDQLTGGSHDGN